MEDRFWSKVDKSGECWVWTAGQSHGYGCFAVKKGKTVYAHRLAYELLVGPIPNGLQIDHLCRNRRCVRPDHLEPVTRKTNILRGESPSARAARVDRCPSGHPYDEANTILYRGSRYCRECKRAKDRRRVRPPRIGGSSGDRNP